MTKKWICPHCGQKMRERNNYCSHCGTSRQEQRDPNDDGWYPLPVPDLSDVNYLGRKLPRVK